MNLPPAAERMSQAAAAAALPTALSFARAAMRLLVRGRWRLEKVRLELDQEGRGEVLYRLRGDGHLFHFFLVSDKLPEALKTDRNFAPGWDAMGVLCEGDWTPEREALMRREVPKQRGGFADYDTLAYARGNRSARLFDAMVEQLAAGRQPDPRLVAPVGYVLRTTAFIANGQLGTRPLAGYPDDHPLRRPYHAQFVAAFLLREFVFDLVDHLARVRDPRAVRLAPDHRRYLGIGNSAATGLVHYVANHPRQLQGWIGAIESALAHARARPMQPGSPELARGILLLDRAIAHVRDGRRPADGVFEPLEATIPALLSARRALAAYAETGRMFDVVTTTPWLGLAANPGHSAGSEEANGPAGPLARAVLDAILLELHPALLAPAEDDPRVDEHLEVDPAMTSGELAALIDRDYAWMLERKTDPRSEQHFWYRTTATPRDIRRGLRGRRGGDEHETTLDTVRQARALRRALAESDPAEPLARLLFERPELRQVAARIRTLAGEHYAEVRVEPLATEFSPFAPIRLLLALFGLEKFEAAPPKSVRGTFLQGAPIAEDVAAGRDGSWPFPPMPGDAEDADGTRLDPPPPGLGIAAPPAAAIDIRQPDPRTERRIAPGELTRMVRIALQGGGASLGDAEAAARLVVQESLLDAQPIAALLHDLERGAVARRPNCRIARRAAGHDREAASSIAGGEAGLVADALATAPCEIIEAGGGTAWILAPVACDLAVAAAFRAPSALGIVVARDLSCSAPLAALARRGATFGCLTLVLWRSRSLARTGSGIAGLAAAGPQGPHDWFVHTHGADDEPAWLARLRAAAAGAGLGSAATPLRAAVAAFRHLAIATDGFVVVCMRGGAGPVLPEALAAAVPAVRTLPPGGFAGRLRQADRVGIALPRAIFDRLDAAGRSLLLAAEHEASVLPAGADPLQQF